MAAAARTNRRPAEAAGCRAGVGPALGGAPSAAAMPRRTVPTASTAPVQPAPRFRLRAIPAATDPAGASPVAAGTRRWPARRPPVPGVPERVQVQAAVDRAARVPAAVAPARAPGACPAAAGPAVACPAGASVVAEAVRQRWPPQPLQRCCLPPLPAAVPPATDLSMATANGGDAVLCGGPWSIRRLHASWRGTATRGTSGWASRAGERDAFWRCHAEKATGKPKVARWKTRV